MVSPFAACRPSPLRVAVAAALLGCAGCPRPKPCQEPAERPITRGLAARDFVRISENGFDAADHAEDNNAYAWSMEYFVPDGAETGTIYVGTGNDMTSLVLDNIDAILGSGSLTNVATQPTEIRRLREEDGTITWERVLDFRDLDPTGEKNTIGFRFLKAYRARTDGRNYLYAATMSREAALYRSATGEPGSWEPVWELGDAGSVRMMEPHGGLLYLAISNETGIGQQIGRIWATDGAAFRPVMEDGFGDPANLNVMSLISFNGWLYAGTQNLETGFEVWKLAGPNGDEPPVLVVDRGGPDPVNEAAVSPAVFQDRLYFGAMIYFYNNFLKGFQAADMIRIDANDQWETVVGPGSISGYDSGFNHWPNTYIWNMAEHDGWLYASTYDQSSVFPRYWEAVWNFAGGLLFKSSRQMKTANVFDELGALGADLYRSADGVNWCPVTIDGLGNIGNTGFRSMASVGGDFYLGTTNPFDGLEIWRARSGN